MQVVTCSLYGAAVRGLGARRAPGRRLALSLSVVRTSLTDPALRRLLLAWTAATAGEALAVVALGVYAYGVGGAAAVGYLTAALLALRLPSPLPKTHRNTGCRRRR